MYDLKEETEKIKHEIEAARESYEHLQEIDKPLAAITPVKVDIIPAVQPPKNLDEN